MTFPGKLTNGNLPDTLELSTNQSSSSSNLSITDRSSTSSNLTTLPSTPSTPPPIKNQRSRNGVGAAGSALSLGLMSPTAMPSAPLQTLQPILSPPRFKEAEPGEIDGMVIGRNKPKELYNPRDHSFLEFIYSEMHAVRFVNLEPLALLHNSLSTIFNGRQSFSLPWLSRYSPRNRCLYSPTYHSHISTKASTCTTRWRGRSSNTEPA